MYVPFSSSQDTVSMLSKLKYVREFRFFCFIQFELSHNLHLPITRNSAWVMQNEQITRRVKGWKLR